MKVYNTWFRFLTLAILTGLVSPMISYGMETSSEEGYSFDEEYSTESSSEEQERQLISYDMKTSEEFTAYFKELSKEGVLPKELQYDIRRLQLLKDVVLIGLLKPVWAIGSNDKVTAVAFSDPASGGSKIVTAEGDHGNFAVNSVSIWDFKTGEELQRLLENEKLVNAVAIAGDKMVTGSDDKTAKVWNINTGELLRTLKEKKKDIALWSIRAVAIIGDKAITTSGQYDAIIWDINTGELLHILEGHTHLIRSIAANKDKVVTGASDYRAKIWDINTGRLLHTLDDHTNTVTSVAISDDRVITGSADKTAKIWDINTGQLLRTLKGHQEMIRSVAAIDDKVVTGSDDKTAKVWNINTGKLLYTITGHTKQINSVAISSYIGSSGKRNYMVATGSDDKDTNLWILPPDLRGSSETHSIPWIIEKATIRQLDFIKRAYYATMAGEEFTIAYPSEDAIVMLSFPAHVKKYLLDRLNIKLKMQQ